jgi:hypothetical protein
MTELQYSSVRPGDLVSCLSYPNMFNMLVIRVDGEYVTHNDERYKSCRMIRGDGEIATYEIMLHRLNNWHMHT